MTECHMSHNLVLFKLDTDIHTGIVTLCECPPHLMSTAAIFGQKCWQNAIHPSIQNRKRRREESRYVKIVCMLLK